MPCIFVSGGNLPQTRFGTRFTLGLLSWLVFLSGFLAPARAARPLSVESRNPRFFVDSNGKAVYLTGVHLNNDLVNRSDKQFWTLRTILIFFSNTSTISCACGRGN